MLLLGFKRFCVSRPTVAAPKSKVLYQHQGFDLDAEIFNWGEHWGNLTKRYGNFGNVGEVWREF